MVNVTEFDANNGQRAENEEKETIVPTEEELKSWHHISDRVPYLSWLIIIFVMCQTFAYCGHSVLFQNYIQFPVPGPGNDQPGALNQGQQTATAITSAFNLFTLITPIFGAIVADQYWGKFRTIAIASVLHIVAEIILIVTSIPVSIRVGLAFPGLIVMMIIFSFASGGIHANLSSFMAEQYTVTTPSIRGKTAELVKLNNRTQMFLFRNSRNQKNCSSNRVGRFNLHFFSLSSSSILFD